jgi:peptidoglycan/LPS O-acetylase OafA/YrhL
MMPEPVTARGRYMGGLDGLRAIAVLAVIAYHLGLSWAPGGLLGVGVFFVLSGYLITDLLVAGYQNRGRIDLRDFWVRRARRLLPALAAMLIVVVAWVTLFHPGELASLRGDVLAAALYMSNWWYIYHHVSYFAQYGPPSPLTHLWSLAVEEQFYLVWPLALALGLKYVRNRNWLVTLVLIAAVASAVAMAVMYHPGINPNRVYYGTDTRAFALLFGAALALLWPSRNMASRPFSRTTVNILDGVGIMGVLAIVLMVWQTNQYQTFLYRGGLVLLSLATLAVVAALVHPSTQLSKILAFKPLRWIGVRSYGIYLWHYPIIVLTNPTLNTGGINFGRASLQVAASIGLAALSWRYLEEPIRRGGLRSLRVDLGNLRIALVRIMTGTAALVLVGISVVGLTGWTPAHLDMVSSMPLGAPIPQTLSVPLLRTRINPVTTPEKVAPAPKEETAKIRATVTAPQSGLGVTAIGDSVMIDAAPYLSKLLPGIVISAKVGRQLYQASAVIATLKKEGELGQRVIIELGTNGPFSEAQLVSLLDSLGPVQQIVLVNTRVPRPWQSVVNSTLAEVARTFPHTTLVNWYAASANHNNYFWPDGVHLNPTGAQAYAVLLAKSVDP